MLRWPGLRHWQHSHSGQATSDFLPIKIQGVEFAMQRSSPHTGCSACSQHAQQMNLQGDEKRAAIRVATLTSKYILESQSPEPISQIVAAGQWESALISTH